MNQLIFSFRYNNKSFSKNLPGESKACEHQLKTMEQFLCNKGVIKAAPLADASLTYKTKHLALHILSDTKYTREKKNRKM